MPQKTNAEIQTAIDGIKDLITADGKIDAAELDSVLTDINDSKINNADADAGGFVAFTTLTDAATISWDCSGGYNRTVTLGGNRTLSISNAVDGSVGVVKVTQDGTGSRTLTLPGSSVISGGYFALSTAPGFTDILIFIKNGTTYNWFISNNVQAP